MVALVDCNNFYASCERLFQPRYNGRPVVVLSNNDGCVIARSNEAKDLGIRMGEPFFKIEAGLKRAGVAVFSSNYSLYGDMSARVMTNLARFSPKVEVYSIDECFLDLTGFTELEAYAHRIRQTVIRNTGIPVSVGIAPTKVLAKVANKLCKRTQGVCVLDTDEKIREALENFEVGDLWGIGRASVKKLHAAGIFTAADLRRQSIGFVKSRLTIQGVRMWNELWGKPCLQVSEVLDRKKGLCTGRSFGKMTGELQQLEEATASYAHRLSMKLRKDRSCATVITVRLLTNRFKAELPQTFPSVSMALDSPANNVHDLVRAALSGLKKIYRSGYLYQKVEVSATGLIPEEEVQMNLFQDWQGPARDKLSKVMDRINLHYGRGTVRIAAEGTTQKWKLRSDFLSPCYTTRWKDIVKVY